MCLMLTVSHPPHHAVRSADSKRCSRQVNAWWNSWKRIIPNCRCWPGLMPSWWKTLCFCLWALASFCEYTNTAALCGPESVCVVYIIIEISVDLLSGAGCIVSDPQCFSRIVIYFHSQVVDGQRKIISLLQEQIENVRHHIHKLCYSATMTQTEVYHL